MNVKVNNPIDTDSDPSPKPGARRLREYWVHGEGAAKIKWGVPGDFKRCVHHLEKYVTDAEGLCNVYHRSALGVAPGQEGRHKSDALTETRIFAQSLKQLECSEYLLDLFKTIDETETKDNMENELEHKSLSVSGGIIETKDDEGIVEALVSVTGNVDNVNDVIEPGAYTKTLQERKPKGVWAHDWNTPICKALDMEEWMPGDPRLPDFIQPGHGALYVKAQFNLATQRGREAYSDVKFYGEDSEWSIGYSVPKGKSTKGDDGIRRIQEIKLFEFSPVLFGANSSARSLIKSAKAMFESEEEFLSEVKELVTVDPEPEPEKKTEETPVTGEIKVLEEARAEDHIVPLTAETVEQIKTLYNQLGDVINLFNSGNLVVANPVVTPDKKTLEQAYNDLLYGDYDAAKTDNVGVFVKSLQSALETKDSNRIIPAANEVLDELTNSLQDIGISAESRKNLVDLVAAVGYSIEVIEEEKTVEPEVETIVEPVVEEVKQLTLSADELKLLLSID